MSAKCAPVPDWLAPSVGDTRRNNERSGSLGGEKAGGSALTRPGMASQKVMDRSAKLGVHVDAMGLSSWEDHAEVEAVMGTFASRRCSARPRTLAATEVGGFHEILPCDSVARAHGSLGVFWGLY